MYTLGKCLATGFVQALIAFFVVCIYLFHFCDYTPPSERNVEDHIFNSPLAPEPTKEP